MQRSNSTLQEALHNPQRRRAYKRPLPMQSSTFCENMCAFVFLFSPVNAGILSDFGTDPRYFFAGAG
jgi:hypothetical protein